MSPWSLIGLPIAFVILASLHLWLAVDLRFSKTVKFLSIAAVIWFGLILFYTPSRIMGWPVNSTYNTLPNMGVVLSWKIIEPNINAPEAGIYIWLVPKKFGQTEKSFFEILRLDPRHAFTFTLKDTPRCYKLPYDREEHRQLSKKATDARKKRGVLMFKKGKGRWGKKKISRGQAFEDKSNWRVLDPSEILKKYPEDE